MTWTTERQRWWTYWILLAAFGGGNVVLLAALVRHLFWAPSPDGQWLIGTFAAEVVAAAGFAWRRYFTESSDTQTSPQSNHTTTSTIPIEDRELLANLNTLRSDRCPLFAKAAADKYSEVKSYVKELQSDRMEIHYTEQMSETLEYLFCDVEFVHEIIATSYGELIECGDESKGWIRNYLRIHDKAIGLGKIIRRIFILTSESEEITGKDAFVNNKSRGVQVKTVLRKRISNQDIGEAGNCIIFCQAPNVPIYCLQARHTSDGEFAKAIIYRDQQHMRQLVKACKRIDANATPY